MKVKYNGKTGALNHGQSLLDAVVNGELYEFRNITGTVRQIEEGFREAKRKGDNINVFVHVETNTNMYEAWRRIGLVLTKHPEFTGNVILSIKGGNPIYRDSNRFK